MYRAALHLLGEDAVYNFRVSAVLAHPSMYGRSLEALLQRHRDVLQVNIVLSRREQFCVPMPATAE